ncbi:MAG: SDR family oxidoreductase [Caulobacterales bacterium]
MAPQSTAAWAPRFDGRVALISGAASGIGAETARQFCAAGAAVILSDRDEANGAALADALGDSARFVPLDVTQEDQWRAAIAVGETAFDKIDIVINCAGVSKPATIEQADMAHWREILSINLDGAFLGCKHGVAALKRAGGGAIVNVASMLGARGGAMFPAYAASKWGLRGLTHSVALHCAEAGLAIRANCVLPGAIETPMLESYVRRGVAQGAPREAVLTQFAQAHAMKRVGQPTEVVAAILFLASDGASFITGADVPVEGGALA